MCAIVANFVLIHFLDVLYIQCHVRDSLVKRFCPENVQFRVLVFSNIVIDNSVRRSQRVALRNAIVGKLVIIVHGQALTRP